MAQLFHPSMNHIARASIIGGILILAGGFAVGASIFQSPLVTQVNVPRDQPVPFSHEHHVGGLGIDCRYCHTQVENSYYAGMPSTKTCMTCHSQIWTNAELLQPVRDSWKSGKPIRWTRVHDVPDFVQFNHSIHVNKGVGCASCHGEVDKMPLMWKTNTMYMQWCLDCHKAPEKFVRPREEVFNLHWVSKAADPVAEGRELLKQYHIPTADYAVHGRAGEVAEPGLASAAERGEGTPRPRAEGVGSKRTGIVEDPHKRGDVGGETSGYNGVEKQPNPLTNCSVCHY